MNIIIGALAVFAGAIFVGSIISSISDIAIHGGDEQKTWEKIERWRN